MPPFPDELQHLWAAYRDLAEARSSGMGPSPIGFAEIEAYQRVMLNPLTAWQARLIRRLDVVVLAALNPDNKDAQAVEHVAANDTAGLKAMFGGMAARRKRR